MMRWRTLPIELLILAFLAVFLLYPLAYVVPGAASEDEYEVRLLDLGATPQQKAEVITVLAKIQPQAASLSLRLPHVVQTFPLATKADTLATKLRQAGAQVDVVRQRHWTGFYFQQALGFQFERATTFPWVRLVPYNPFLWECLHNSLILALATTLLTTLVSLPLAYALTRRQFAGRGLLASLLLVPLIIPPFVGAIGVEHFLGRFGTLNLWLMRLGVLGPGSPIDWVGEGGFLGVLLMQVLHLYPIMYLNLAAAWANVDPTLEDAARNLGASEGRLFRTITFPLLLPGFFAGATLVFVWAFTDLGVPLVFGVEAVVPVQIYNQVSDPQRTNSTAYALVVLTLIVTAALFYSARWLVGRQAFIGGGKGAVAAVVPTAGRGATLLLYGYVLFLTFFAILPSLGVVLTACSERWVFTPLPETYTASYLREVWSNRIAADSIRNSLFYSGCSTVLDIFLGVALAWLVTRRPSWLTSALDGLAMLPLALPGLVLAFGYLTCYSNWNLGAFLNPVKNPVPLLIVAYGVRRLPYLARSAQAGLQQLAPVMEEAAENLGATRWRVLRTITVPLIAANIIAGAVLTFAFAVLEVSDSLMLAREEKFYPITRAILGLLMRPDDGDNVASALAVFAMGLLGVSLLAASLTLGRKMGELFRA
jgi:iron(III) transport system permease protein